MERRTFVKLVGLSSAGLAVGNESLAITTHKQVISINEPKVHVRHGLFNLQNQGLNNKDFFVQRDIFCRNGLNDISSDRISTISVKYDGKESFGIISNNVFNSKTTKIQAIRLTKNRSKHIKIKRPSLIFGEFAEFTADNAKINSDRSLLVDASEIKFTSKEDQYIILYESEYL